MREETNLYCMYCKEEIKSYEDYVVSQGCLFHLSCYKKEKGIDELDENFDEDFNSDDFFTEEQ